MNNTIKHFGVLGMRWGKRKSSTANQSIQRVGRDRFLVEKTRSGKIIAKAKVTKALAEEFIAKQKEEKAAALYDRNLREEKVRKAVSAIFMTYAAVTVTNLLAPGFLPKVARTVAWNLGSVVSNSPLR